jgi:hypothetical protein
VLLFASVPQHVAQAQRPDAPPTPTAGYSLPVNQPERGLIYDGLAVTFDGTCPQLYKLSSTSLCTHGPDPAPNGVDLSHSAPPIAPGLLPTAATVQCDGDGTSGNRVQVIYAHASDHADRYSTYAGSIQSWVGGANQIYIDSAAETGGSRHVRWVTDTTCNPNVLDVQLSTTGDDNFNNMVSELKSKGYNRTDRKYLVFMDANVYCGIASIWGDDKAGAINSNNTGPSFARVDSGCWDSTNGPQVAAHETMHNMGGVQMSAPHSSGGWHCVDEWDRMCYSDSPNYPAMQYICSSSSHDRLFDCNHDDYYSTNPAGGSYLATHWNAANNQFLSSDAVSGCGLVPNLAQLTSPVNGATVTVNQVPLDWTDVGCATEYHLVVKRGSTSGQTVDNVRHLTFSQHTTPPLTRGKSYYWHVKACDAVGCSAWTAWSKFTITP